MDTTVACWGYGVGPDGGNSTTPVALAGITGATSVGVGGNICVSLSNGGVRCKGDNTRGGLGDGRALYSTTPVAVVGFDDDEPTDATAPAITISTPASGQRFALGTLVSSAFTCQDEPGGSGVAACTGPATVDTTTPGQRTFTVKATDRAGNQRTAEVVYHVDAPTQPPAAISDTTSPPPPATKKVAPRFSGPASAKASKLTRGVSVTVKNLKPRSKVTLRVRLGKSTLATIKAQANGRGEAKLKLKLAKKRADRARRKQLSLVYAVTTSDGRTQTVTRRLKVT